MKKLSTIMLAIICIIVVLPITTSADSRHETIISSQLYYIYHVNSGRVLDVDAGQINQNGTQLQIYDKYSAHNNQVFVLVDTGEGWHIYSYASKKIVEVRNSSHEAYAQVAQWDNNGQKCGKWDIIYNTDGTISFKNCESGLYMNVYGNYTENGTKIIQYPHDGTTAEKFKLYNLTTADVLNAKWTRHSINISDVSWTPFINGWRVDNNTNWKIDGYYPTPNKKYLTTITYIDPGTVAKIIDQESRRKTDFKTDIIASVLTSFMPGGISEFIEIYQAMDEAEANKYWNKFLDTAKISEKGCNGIIIYTYLEVKSRIPTSHYDRRTIVYFKKVQEFSSWTGSNFEYVRYNTDNMDGSWNYNFK
jgi:hypothetical protein